MLPDQDFRELAAEQVNRNTVVLAGAGTGKTTCLIRRLLALLGEGCRCGELVAITFTEAAAAELRRRLRDGVEEKIDNGGGTLWQRAREELEDARVSTIHAFAASLLREHPLAAGVAPEARVVDPIQARRYLAKAWRRFTGEVLDHEDPEWEEILLEATPEEVRLLAYRLAELGVPVGPEELGDADTVLEEWQARWAHAIGQLRELVAGRESFPSDALTRCAAALLSLDADSGASARALVERMTAPGFALPPTGRGSAKTWQGAEDRREPAAALVKVLKAHLKELEEFPKTLRQHRITASALVRLQRFLELYREEKARAAVLDYQDLLHMARDMLRDHPRLRLRLGTRIRHILVDEFQDTDTLQAEIVLFLCDETGTARDWRETRPRPGQLFLVGDPKQAIYGWRGARMSLFRDVREFLEEHGALTGELESNFRSSPPIIRFVNEYFSDHMKIQEGGRLQPDYAHLAACRTEPPAPGPALHIVGRPGRDAEGRRLPLQESREALAVDVAQRIAEIEGTLQISDPRRGLRPTRLGDIAVLTRSNGMLRMVEDALQEQAIPYTTQASGGLFRREEVSDLMLALRLLADPGDRLLLAGVLRSSLFGFDDEALRRLAVEEKLRLDTDAPGLPPPIREAYGQLRNWHLAALREPAPDLIRRVLSESLLPEVSAAHFDGEQRAANLTRVVELAELHTPQEDPTLHGFLELLRSQESDWPEEKEFLLSSESEPSVHLTTMHGAKGLEFPVVFLFGLEPRPNRQETRVVREGEEAPGKARVGIPFGPWNNLGWEYDLKEKEKARREAESLRVLYVSMTRARDHLVLCGIFPNTEHGGHWTSITGMLGLEEADFPLEPCKAGNGLHERNGLGFRVWSPGRGSVFRGTTMPDPRDVAALPVPSPDPLSALRAAESLRREEGETEARHPLDLTPSLLDQEQATTPPRGEREPDLAAKIGTTVHAVLESLPPGYEEGWRDRLDEVLRERTSWDPATLEQVGTRTGELLASLFASDLWPKLSGARRWWSEIPILLGLDGGRVLRGRADLLLEWEDGSLEILDWKSDDLSAASRSPEEAAEDHRHQALGYTRAVALATGRPVRFSFVYLDAGRAVSYPPEPGR